MQGNQRAIIVEQAAMQLALLKLQGLAFYELYERTKPQAVRNLEKKDITSAITKKTPNNEVAICCTFSQKQNSSSQHQQTTVLNNINMNLLHNEPLQDVHHEPNQFRVHHIGLYDCTHEKCRQWIHVHQLLHDNCQYFLSVDGFFSKAKAASCKNQESRGTLSQNHYLKATIINTV